MLAAALAAMLAACASAEPPIDPREPALLGGVQGAVQQAVVLAVKPMAPGPAAGPTSITAAREQLFVGAAGALAGAVSGERAPSAPRREQSVLLLLQLQGGERRSVVQAAGDGPFAPGDPVFVVVAGGQLRVLRAPPAPAASPPPAATAWPGTAPAAPPVSPAR